PAAAPRRRARARAGARRALPRSPRQRGAAPSYLRRARRAGRRRGDGPRPSRRARHPRERRAGRGTAARASPLLTMTTAMHAGFAPRLAVRDPARGTVVDELPIDDPSAVAAAVQRARDVQPAWAALAVRERARRVK